MPAITVFRDTRRYIASLLGLAMLLGSPGVRANDWVYGTVKWIEDYGSYCCAADGHQYQVMVSLTNKTWANGADAAICTERFRVVTGLQGVTEEIKKNATL